MRQAGDHLADLAQHVVDRGRALAGDVRLDLPAFLAREIADLEQLADDCAQDGRYDFLYVAAPLKVAKAAGFKQARKVGHDLPGLSEWNVRWVGEKGYQGIVARQLQEFKKLQKEKEKQ